MRPIFKTFIVFCLVFSFVGCFGLQTRDAPETPLETYYKALGVWDAAADKFERYQTINDEATKAEWDEKFLPPLLKSKSVLDLWYNHLLAGDSTASEMEQWRSLKGELIFFIATQIQ